MGFKSLSRRLEGDARFQELMDAEFPYRRLANSIVQLRVERGMTQRDLASLTKTSQPVIARLESGRHAVRVEMLSRIAVALDLTWEPIFEPRVAEPMTGSWVVVEQLAVRQAHVVTPTAASNEAAAVVLTYRVVDAQPAVVSGRVFGNAASGTSEARRTKPKFWADQRFAAAVG